MPNFRLYVLNFLCSYTRVFTVVVKPGFHMPARCLRHGVPQASPRCLPADLNSVQLRRHAGDQSLNGRRCLRQVFPYIGKVSQVVPGTASQACRRHMETRLKDRTEWFPKWRWIQGFILKWQFYFDVEDNDFTIVSLQNFFVWLLPVSVLEYFFGFSIRLTKLIAIV